MRKVEQASCFLAHMRPLTAMKRLAKRTYCVPCPFLVFQVLWDTEVGSESSFLSTVFHGAVKKQLGSPFAQVAS